MSTKERCEERCFDKNTYNDEDEKNLIANIKEGKFYITILCYYAERVISINPIISQPLLTTAIKHSRGQFENQISFHIISNHIISYHIILSHIISYHIISYHFMLYHIISFHAISFSIISYHIISYNII